MFLDIVMFARKEMSECTPTDARDREAHLIETIDPSTPYCGTEFESPLPKQKASRVMMGAVTRA